VNKNLGNLQVSANGTDTTLNVDANEGNFRVDRLIIDTSQTVDFTEVCTFFIHGSGTGVNRPLIVNGSLTDTWCFAEVEYLGTSETDLTVPTYVANICICIDSGTVTYHLGSGAGQTLNMADLGSVSGVTINADTYDPDIVTENVSINDSTFVKGSGLWTIKRLNSGSGTLNLGVAQDMGNVRISSSFSGNTTVATTTNLIVTALTIDSNQTLDLASGSRTLTLTSNSTPLTLNGTLTDTDDTLLFVPGSAGTVTIPSRSYYSVTFNGVGSTFRPGSSTLTVTEDLTVTNGILDLNTNDPIVVAKDVSFAGTISASASSAFTASGSWDNDGTFTHNNGTITLSPISSLSSIIVAGSGTNNNVFYNLNAGPLGTIKFESGDTITIVNTFDWNGAGGSPLSIEPETPASAWTIYFQGTTASYSFVSISYSSCHGSSNNIISSASTNQTVINSGNNGSCWAFQTRGSGNGASGGGSGSGGAEGGGGSGGGGGGSDGGSGGGGSEGGGGSGGGGGGSP
jgi:hypothetical protein